MTPDQLIRLEDERNVWVATSRPDGRPHLTPVWFAWHNKKFYICIQPTSVKARNLAGNSALALSLEDGSKPVICEGNAEVVALPWQQAVIDIFERKYGWRIDQDSDYTMLVGIAPSKWLSWKTGENE